MSGIPEGAETATGEGRDLASAIANAAETLGVDVGEVAWKLDMSHFRSGTGGSMAQRTVRIIGWKRTGDEPAPKTAIRADEVERAPRSERSERPEREERPRRERDDKRKPEGLKGAEEGTTPASEFAEAWFRTLLEHMDIEGKVEGTGSEDRIHLRVRADKAGRLIGKRGTTLAAIRHLLALALEPDHGEPTLDVDVDDLRPRADKGAEGGERKKRRRSEGRGGGRRREDRGEGGGDRIAEGKLRALARRAAEKALETGKPITINLELNSYDRRIVHVEVAEIEGVTTRSEPRGAGKVVQIVPE